MDKLRALQYFLVAAELRSFSAAARRLDVTATAVIKLVDGLERSLGVRLLERSAAGVTLTAPGDRYRQACTGALVDLADADEQVRAFSSRVRGTLVVGVQHVIARGCLAAALPRFHQRHPEIRLDLREFSRVTDEQINGVDVFLVMGWPRAEDLVQRRISSGRFVVAASPEYWDCHGTPEHPGDLARHVCLPIRAVDGTIMDLWSFTRDGERVEVAVGGWLTSANSHRDTVLDLALAGHGVVRLLDFTDRELFASGRLVRALVQWDSPEAPPVNLLYRPAAARSVRARLFMAFVMEIFGEIEAWRGRRIEPTDAPSWLWRHHGSATAAGARSARRTDATARSGPA